MAFRTNWFDESERTNGVPPLQHTVAEILQSLPVMISPDTTAVEALRLAEHLDAHYLPVVTPLGSPLGVLCRCDLRRASPAARAASCLRRPAFTISTAATPRQAAETLLELGVGCLPVVDDFSVVGMVTRADLVRAGALPTRLAPACALCGCLEHVAVAEPPALPLCRPCRDDGQATAAGGADDHELGGSD